MSHRKYRKILSGVCLVCCAWLGVLAGCQTSHVGRELLLDGRIEGRMLALKVEGENLQIPIFRQDNLFHVASTAGQGFAVVLSNRSRVPLRVMVETQGIARGASKTWKESMVLQPGEETRLRGRQAKQAQLSHRFPKWEVSSSGMLQNAQLGDISIRYRTMGKRAYMGNLRVQYGHCQAYAARSICPPSCLCASYYKREVVVVKLDRGSANAFQR